MSNENQPVGETQFQPQVLTWTIHPELGAKISSLAVQFNISESIFLLTCWQTLLWCLSNSHFEKNKVLAPILEFKI
ncbi:MAG: hypothetical protein AN485_22275 [Anabaena sp. MDT14b]|jgi:hypothetical protein|nr:MAG: hypothetical protein AN485_22275 [Anabaena sp. MDT14b]